MSNFNKKIVLVTNGLPYPGNNGIPMFCWSLIEYLTNKKIEVEVVSLCPLNDKFASEEYSVLLEKLGISPVIFKYSKNPTYFASTNLAVRAYYFLTKTKLLNYFPTTSLKREVQNYIKNSNPFVVISVHTEALSVTDGMDARIPVLGIMGDPSHLPLLFNTINDLSIKRPITSFIKLYVLVRDIFRVIKEDIRLLSNSTAVGALAGHYSEWFKKKGVLGCEYFRLPIFDDGCLSKPRAGENRPNKKFRVILLGALHGTATISGLELFTKVTYPKLIDLIGLDNFEVHIYGDGVWPKTVEDITVKSNVFKRGYVEDIKSEMAHADVLVVPTPINLGIRVRILTALSYGQCIVAHKANSQGIPEIKHRKNCLLANSGLEMAELINEIYMDEDLRIALEDGARNTYLKYFHPEIAAENIYKKICKLADKVASR